MHHVLSFSFLPSSLLALAFLFFGRISQEFRVRTRTSVQITIVLSLYPV